MSGQSYKHLSPEVNEWRPCKGPTVCKFKDSNPPPEHCMSHDGKVFLVDEGGKPTTAVTAKGLNEMREARLLEENMANMGSISRKVDLSSLVSNPPPRREVTAEEWVDLPFLVSNLPLSDSKKNLIKTRIDRKDWHLTKSGLMKVIDSNEDEITMAYIDGDFELVNKLESNNERIRVLVNVMDNKIVESDKTNQISSNAFNKDEYANFVKSLEAAGVNEEGRKSVNEAVAALWLTESGDPRRGTTEPLSQQQQDSLSSYLNVPNELLSYGVTDPDTITASIVQNRRDLSRGDTPILVNDKVKKDLRVLSYLPRKDFTPEQNRERGKESIGRSESTFLIKYVQLRQRMDKISNASRPNDPETKVAARRALNELRAFMEVQKSMDESTLMSKEGSDRMKAEIRSSAVSLSKIAGQ